MSIDKVLITGSCGLVGSEAVWYFSNLGCEVVGIDNNHRRDWFGDAGDTTSIKSKLKELSNYRHMNLNIVDEYAMREVIGEEQPDLIIHAAGQPSHEKSSEIPLADFKVNALGTINLLEATRTLCPSAKFAFLSTNKVYGKSLGLKSKYVEIQEEEKRLHLRYMTQQDGRCKFYEEYSGINEQCGIGNSEQTPFGASKAAADLMVQEYNSYFALTAACFRCGCITGRNHQGVEQHGFLSYLCKCAKSGKEYTIYGHKGKQVRDNIHAYDLVRAIHEWAKKPRSCVFNMGGGFNNSCSILEAIDTIKEKTNIDVNLKRDEKRNIQVAPGRKLDHLVYYTDLKKFKAFYQNWEITRNLDSIFEELLQDD